MLLSFLICFYLFAYFLTSLCLQKWVSLALLNFKIFLYLISLFLSLFYLKFAFIFIFCFYFINHFSNSFIPLCICLFIHLFSEMVSSNHLEVFWKGVLKNFTKFTEKSLRSAILLKKRLRHRCFLVHFTKSY